MKLVRSNEEQDGEKKTANRCSSSSMHVYKESYSLENGKILVNKTVSDRWA